MEYLKIHPNISFADGEVHYFDENFDKGIEWYRLVSNETELIDEI